MHLMFTPPRGPSAPPNLLAEAEVRFNPDTPFQGMKLAGFSVWRGDRGVYVTFPSRAFGAGSERKYFDYLRTLDAASSEAARSAITRVKRWIADEYKAWSNGGERGHGPIEERHDAGRSRDAKREDAPAHPRKVESRSTEDW